MLNRLSKDEYVHGILSGNKIILSRAITLIESSLESDYDLASQIITAILPFTGKSKRIGISGVPGVGKSTFIESYGVYLCEKDNKVAVLAIDPSSQKTKGSILGDKTRMEQLSVHPNGYIRPTSSNNYFGGVAAKTREAILLCEAAGFNYVLVETVGVGQTETDVMNMTDFFILLMLAGAGDELQGIKKGIIEAADMLLINKADGDNYQNAIHAKKNYENVLSYFMKKENGWKPLVNICSSLNGFNIDQVYNTLESYFIDYESFITENRSQQTLHWFESLLHFQTLHILFENKRNKEFLTEVRIKIASKEISVFEAVKKILKNIGIK